MGLGIRVDWVRSLILGLGIVLVSACTGRNVEDEHPTTAPGALPSPPAGSPPTVSLSASPSSIDPGENVTLTWASSDATSCSATGGWSGVRDESGSQQVSPSTTTNYVLACDGPDGSANASVSVQVNGTPAPAPTVSFSSADLVVNDGGSTTLTWSSQNADTCDATGGWSGMKSVADSELVGPVTASTTYTISCTGSGGTAIEMLTVSVMSSVGLNWQAPTENVDGSPVTILSAYRIYYGSSSRRYDDFHELTDTTATSGSVDVVPGTYYVAMTAIDGDGDESDYSNEVIKIAN